MNNPPFLKSRGQTAKNPIRQGDNYLIIVVSGALIRLPGMSGIELAGELRRERPNDGCFSLQGCRRRRCRRNPGDYTAIM
jgi:hypothetical protein